VASTGDVYPSGFMPLRLGNVRDGGLLELYDSTRCCSPSGRPSSPVRVVVVRTRSSAEDRGESAGATGNPLGSDPGCLVALEETRAPSGP